MYVGGDGEDGDRVASDGVTESPLLAELGCPLVRHEAVKVVLEKGQDKKISL